MGYKLREVATSSVSFCELIVLHVLELCYVLDLKFVSCFSHCVNIHQSSLCY